METTSSRRPALKYYGSKWTTAPWIISFFPPHQVYVEPFGGSASVLLRKPLSPIEIYNDTNSDLVSFIRVLREEPEKLIRAIELTPVSREEFELSNESSPDPIESARRLYVNSCQAFGGLQERKTTGWRLQTRTWINNRCNPKEWSSIAHLETIATRLKSVQLENCDALSLISKCVSQEALFYLDPPYPASTRNKRHLRVYYSELSAFDHINLLNLLSRLKARVVLSAYENDMYANALTGWHVESRQIRNMALEYCTEYLYMNFKP